MVFPTMLKLTTSSKKLDLCLGLLFEAGLYTVKQKQNGRTIELEVQLLAGTKIRPLMGRLKKLNTQYTPPLFNNLHSVQIKNTSWAKKYQKFLRPFEFVRTTTGKIFVDASGKVPHVLKKNTIYIESTFSFGTGSHATTQMAAQLLCDTIAGHNPVSVLDVGCGSGILSLVAKKLGVKKVVGVDIDGAALKTTAQNMQANHLQGIQLYDDIHQVRKKFDIIVANIMLVPLCQLHDTFVGHLKKNGTLITSGLLYKDVEEFLQTYADLKLVKRSNKKGWSALLLLLRSS